MKREPGRKEEYTSELHGYPESGRARSSDGGPEPRAAEPNLVDMLLHYGYLAPSGL